MKIALVHLNIYQDASLGYQLGLASIASVLLANSIETKYFVLNDLDASDIKEYNPDVLGFYSIETQAKYINNIVKEFPNAYTIVGGPYTTLCPNSIYELDVDAIFRGEGELQLLKFIQSNLTDKDLAGFVFKNQKHTLSPRLTETELQSLPVPYRGSYINDMLKHDTVKRWESKARGCIHFNVTRGCPYSCNFCANSVYNELYGPSVIYRNLEQILTEIKIANETFEYGSVVFADDILTIDAKWFDEFMSAYRVEINKAFAFNSRVECLTEQNLKSIQDMPCILLRMGIESANSEVRKSMNRPMPKKDIEETFKMCHNYGVRTCSYNMLGYPGETPESWKETVDLNMRLYEYARSKGTEHLGLLNVFYPYRGTSIGERCYRENWVLPDISTVSPHIECGLTTPWLSKQQIIDISAEWPSVLNTGG